MMMVTVVIDFQSLERVVSYNPPGRRLALSLQVVAAEVGTAVVSPEAGNCFAVCSLMLSFLDGDKLQMFDFVGVSSVDKLDNIDAGAGTRYERYLGAGRKRLPSRREKSWSCRRQRAEEAAGWSGVWHRWHKEKGRLKWRPFLS